MWNASPLTANLPASTQNAPGFALLRGEARMVARRQCVAVGGSRSIDEGRIVARRRTRQCLQLQHDRGPELHLELWQLLLQRRPGLLAVARSAWGSKVAADTANGGSRLQGFRSWSGCRQVPGGGLRLASLCVRRTCEATVPSDTDRGKRPRSCYSSPALA